MGENKRFCGGFTLIEILIALAVLGVVITPVIGMFTSTAQSNLKSRRNTVALTVARDIMDRIKTGDINSANIVGEIDNYKSTYGVEIKVDVPEDTGSNALEKLKVFVTPFEGMDAEKEGILVASYTTNVFVSSIDTSPPEGTGGGGAGGGGGGIEEPPPEGSDEDDYWNWYNRLLNSLRAVGVIILALTIVPIVLWIKVEELHTPIDALIASYNILVHIHNTYGVINWGHFTNEVRDRYGVHLRIRDFF
ncbi:MAG: hypothetical protein HPY66_3428 [Firmicutes bacterium]|nr:hypothetical protein [Bacillota bacterium]MDI6705417.1 prepilin-type N-terminal cleavage/methylation domain-containing protein [Bacillota bacterium]